MHITDASLWNRKLTAFVGFIYDAVHTRDGHAVADFVVSAYFTSDHFLGLESMRARKPGLQAPSNLAGSKIKNTHFFPSY